MKQDTIERYEAILTYRASNPQASMEEVCQVIGVGASTVQRAREWRKGQMANSGAATGHACPDFSGAVPKDEQLDVIETLRQAAQLMATGQGDVDKDYRKVVINTDSPIAIMKSADWHFGGMSVDYKALLAHVKFLLETEGMYLQLFGDDINMMIMHGVTSTRTDIFTPEQQIKWLEAFVDKCLSAGKLISMGWGNHSDEFTERVAGFGIVKLIVEKKVPYFRGIGYLDLVLRMSDGTETTYPMGFAHKVRFHSFMNSLHGNKRMQQMQTELFGVNRPIAREFITAHTHNPAFSTEGCLPSDRVHFIKCGTFSTDDLFSQRYFGQGRIGVPTVVYRPDRVESVIFPTPWEAMTYLAGVKAEAH